MTEDETQTTEEQYRQQWYSQLSPEHQELALTHQIDQFEAVPSYLERYASQAREEV